MKTVLFSFLLVLLTAGITFSQTEVKKDSVKANKNAPVIIFEKVIHDFGTIPYNGDGTCEFVFKNTGKEPLILQNCQASCGCTVPEWPKDPILKKKTGVVKVKYNTTRVGNFQKTITVTSNASNSPITLTIKGTVDKQDEQKSNAPVKDTPLPSNDQTKEKLNK
jgi:hypothetical protein